MGEDDLNTPLGRRPLRKSRSRLGLVLLVMFVLCGTAILAAALLSDPRGGEPSAVAILPPPAAPRLSPAPTVAAAAPGDPMPTASTKSASSASATSPLIENGVNVYRAAEGQSAPGPLVIKVPQALGLSEVAAVDKRLIEQTRYGPLPKIAADGARSSEAYARPPVFSGRVAAGTPRIAILVTGLGLDRALTDEAIRTLPAAVTLAFSPYGEGLDAAVERAKAAGHEVLLQLASAGGSEGSAPHALRTGAPRAELIDDLHWLMSRMSGYVGISNLSGSLATDHAAMTTMLQEIGGRGLLYVEDRRPIEKTDGPAPAIGPAVGVDLATGTEAEPAVLRAAAVKLEATARAKGAAVLAVSASAASLATLAVFATATETRNLALVPVSSLATSTPALARTP